MPQVVVLADHLARFHERDRDVGDVSLQADQRSSSCQRGIIESLTCAGGLDEARRLRLLGALDHRPRPRLLGIESLVVAHGTFAGVLPDRPPRGGMPNRIPDRFGPPFHGVDHAAGVPGGDGVDDLPIGEHITVPMEMGRQISGRLRHPGADDELQAGLVESGEIRRRQHAGVGGDDHLHALEVVPGLELTHHGDQGVGFGLVAFETGDLQWEPGAVDEQPDHDLWIDPALFGVADLAQVVFLLGLEVQGGHIEQQQSQPAGAGRVLEAAAGDPVAVVAGDDLREVALNRFVRHRISAEIAEDAQGIDLRGRFDDPGDDQVFEHRVVDDVEAEPVVDEGEHVVEQPGAGAHGSSRPGELATLARRRAGQLAGPPVGNIGDLLDGRRHIQLQHALIAVQQVSGSFEQNAQLDVGMRGPDVSEDLVPAAVFAHDLHRDRSGCGAHFPHECHGPNLPA